MISRKKERKKKHSKLQTFLYSINVRTWKLCFDTQRYQTCCISRFVITGNFSMYTRKHYTKSNYKRLIFSLLALFLGLAFFCFAYFEIDKKSFDDIFFSFLKEHVIFTRAEHRMLCFSLSSPSYYACSLRATSRIVKRLFKFRSLLMNGNATFLTCLLKTATSSLKESDEHTSPPATPGSRGVHVASSHFSNINANSGKSGCL